MGQRLFQKLDSPKTFASGDVITEALGPLLTSRSETAEHEMNHAEMDHRFAGTGKAFVIFAVAAITAKPSEGSFDDPAFGQQHEADGVGGAADDLDDPLGTNSDEAPE